MSGLDALIGQVVGGRYRIERLLGKGGFGAVYAATHLELSRPVAVKVLLASAQEGDALLARFRREARLQDELRHPAIVKLRDFGRREDGLCFMVQEFVDGRTLDALVAGGPLAPGRAVRLVCGVLEGLAEAHWRGIVHRDLKPANIMVVDGPGGEEVRILDFGIAKGGDLGEESQSVTQTGQLLGTPAFMSPEQIEGQRVTAAADLYAMGVVLFVLLTGRRPFMGSLRAVLTAHLVRPVPALPEGLPVGLGGVIARAMAKDPGARFGSAGEMRGALLGVLEGVETTAVERVGAGLEGAGALDETAVTPTPSSDWRGAVVTGGGIAAVAAADGATAGAAAPGSWGGEGGSGAAVDGGAADGADTDGRGGWLTAAAGGAADGAADGADMGGRGGWLTAAAGGAAADGGAAVGGAAADTDGRRGWLTAAALTVAAGVVLGAMLAVVDGGREAAGERVAGWTAGEQGAGQAAGEPVASRGDGSRVGDGGVASAEGEGAVWLFDGAVAVDDDAGGEAAMTAAGRGAGDAGLGLATAAERGGAMVEGGRDVAGGGGVLAAAGARGGRGAGDAEGARAGGDAAASGGRATRDAAVDAGRSSGGSGRAGGVVERAAPGGGARASVAQGARAGGEVGARVSGGGGGARSKEAVAGRRGATRAAAEDQPEVGAAEDEPEVRTARGAGAATGGSRGGRPVAASAPDTVGIEVGALRVRFDRAVSQGDCEGASGLLADARRLDRGRDFGAWSDRLTEARVLGRCQQSKEQSK